MIKYFKVWRKLASASLQMEFSSRLNAVCFIGGKLIRFFFMFIFLIGLLGQTKTLAGYSLEQTLFFFLTFNIVDITAQLLFRGIYLIKQKVQQGSLDLLLAQPLNVLFRVASDMVDFWDLVSLVPIIAATVVVVTRLEMVTWWSAFFYVALLINGVMLALSIHIMVAAIAVYTEEVDNTIWIYRDLMGMARVPVDIYAKPVQLVLTVVVPVAVIVTFPAKALMGLLAPEIVVLAVSFAALFLALSLISWQQALKYYASASS